MLFHSQEHHLAPNSNHSKSSLEAELRTLQDTQIKSSIVKAVSPTKTSSKAVSSTDSANEAIANTHDVLGAKD